jgi:hypothetical protein
VAVVTCRSVPDALIIGRMGLPSTNFRFWIDPVTVGRVIWTVPEAFRCGTLAPETVGIVSVTEPVACKACSTVPEVTIKGSVTVPEATLCHTARPEIFKKGIKTSEGDEA